MSQVTTTATRELQRAISEAKELDLRVPTPSPDFSTALEEFKVSMRAFEGLGREQDEFVRTLTEMMGTLKMMYRFTDPARGLDAKIDRLVTSLNGKLG